MNKRVIERLNKRNKFIKLVFDSLRLTEVQKRLMKIEWENEQINDWRREERNDYMCLWMINDSTIDWLMSLTDWLNKCIHAHTHTHTCIQVYMHAERNKLNKIWRNKQKNEWWMLLSYRSCVTPLLFLLTPLEFWVGCTLVDDTAFTSVLTAEEVDSSCCFSRLTISKSWLVPTLNSCAHFLRCDWRDCKD